MGFGGILGEVITEEDDVVHSKEFRKFWVEMADLKEGNSYFTKEDFYP